MHFEITRTGGVTGLTRRWSTDIPDEECAPLVAELREADNKANRPDEWVYEIRLGNTTAVIAEHDTHHGELAFAIRHAQRGHQSP